MIKRLRRHIIIVNMAMVGVVFLLIFAILCYNSYKTAYENLEHGMNQTLMRESKDSDGFMPPDEPGERRDDKSKMPIQISSYVIVTLDNSGDIASKKENNSSVDSETLKACVKIAAASHKPADSIGEYSLMYVKNDFQGEQKIIFSDSSSVTSMFTRTLLICAGLFFGSMVIVFFISLLLSGFAVKPVKKAWEQQRQFVADASHELKTPLTVILANNNIMASHPESKVCDERQWLESTEEEAQHMKQLIDQMLFLAKSDSGNANVQLSDVDFSEIAEACALNYEPVAFEREILLDADIERDIILFGNSLQLNQLARILIDNAVKYSDDGGIVTIRLKKTDDKTVFTVNNFGSVISKDDLEHIFDRFYRAEKSRTTKGYGLGLSIAQNIAESMNGKITAESSAEKGTTFTVTFGKRKQQSASRRG